MAERQHELFPAAPQPPAGAATDEREDLAPHPDRGRRRELDWAKLASEALGAPVEVRYGHSRNHPVQLERGWSEAGALRYRLRLHRFFEDASDEAALDLVAWVRAGRRAKRATARLDAWIAERLTELPPRTQRGMTLVARGAVHDLDRIAKRVVADPSAGPVCALAALPPIGWGRWPTRAPRRRLQLGAFDASKRVVRIHPALDDAAVPEHVVEYVVFHELLHCAVGRADGNRHHGPTFRRAEAEYNGTDAACTWVEAHTTALLERVARHVRKRRRGRRS